MASMRVFQYTEQELTQLANQVKEVLLDTLVKEKIVNGELDQLCARYVVVISRPSIFGRIWGRVRGIKPQQQEDLTILVLNSPDSTLKEI